MGLDLRVYPNRNLVMMQSSIMPDGEFCEEFEHLIFHRDYELFSQIQGYNRSEPISKIVVPSLRLTTKYQCEDSYGNPLTFAHCEDFRKIILPADIAVKNKAIINYLVTLKNWLAVLYWC
jgi:hypothetical protein